MTLLSPQEQKTLTEVVIRLNGLDLAPPGLSLHNSIFNGGQGEFGGRRFFLTADTHIAQRIDGQALACSIRTDDWKVTFS